MWNYDFAIAEILLLALIAISYVLQNKLPLQKNKTFFVMVLLEVLVLFLDVYGTFLVDDFQMENYAIAHFVNVMYFFFFVLRNTYFTLFTVDVLQLRNSTNKKYVRTAFTICAIAQLIVLTTFFLPSIFYLDVDGYHRGPLYFSIYVAFTLDLLLSFYWVHKYGNRIEKRERTATIAYWCILIVGYIVRIFFKGTIILDLFCLCVIYVGYLYFVNPMYYLEATTNLFNDKGLLEKLTETVGHDSYQLLVFALRNNVQVKEIYNRSDLQEAQKQIGAFLRKSYPNQLLFFIENSYFIIFSNNRFDEDVMMKEIRNRFNEGWQSRQGKIYLQPVFINIDSTLGIPNVDVLIQNIQAAVHQAVDYKMDQDLSLEQMMRQISVKKALHHAIDENRVQVYLQPIVDAQTQKVVGAESLARIIDDDLGMISPGEFIPYAEEDGSIMNLGEQVFAKTCQFIKEHNHELHLHWVNVNLSPMQCIDRGLPRRLAAIRDAYDIPKSIIHLELTEETMINTETLKKQMEELISYGFSMSLDDFGSGYSNINRVINYPLSNIKLDMGLIKAHFTNPNSLLIEMIAALLNTGYTVTAEGVETRFEYKSLQQMGVTYLQGYYFSRPISIDTFVERYQTDSYIKN